MNTTTPRRSWIEALEKPFTWLCLFGVAYFLAAAIYAGWREHTSTPEQRFEQRLEAERQVRQGGTR